MRANEYQTRAMSTRLPSCENATYMLFGLMAEVGEIADKIAEWRRKSCRRMQSAVACAESQMPVLSVLRATYGEKWTAAYLVLWIVNVQEFFNISAKMNDAQVTETAYMILDDFWALNLADVNLVFTNAKRGQYGQLYGRIDGSIIYGWFQTYFEDRCNACENRTIRQAEAMSSDHPVTDAKAAEFIKSLINKKAEKVAK